MTIDELVERWGYFKNCDFDKTLFQEYVTFCNFAPLEDFENYLKVKELKEYDFFSLVDFFYHYDCYNLLYRLLRDNRERIILPNLDIVKSINLRKDIDERMKRLVM